MTDKEIVAKYGRSEQGNFGATDTIGVPHPYMIGVEHVGHAADHFGGMLSKEAVEDAERKGVAHCGWKDCQLKFAEHKQALVVECLADMRDLVDSKKMNAELHAYLLKHKEAATADHFEGFAFLDKRKEKGNGKEDTKPAKEDTSPQA